MLLNQTEVRRKIKQDRNGLYRLIQYHDFPEHFESVNGQRFWIEGDIDNWLETHLIDEVNWDPTRSQSDLDVIWDDHLECAKILTNDKYYRVSRDDITFRENYP
jgi:hypothetical protein